MFIAALFIIAKTWKQPRCPLTDEWIKKMWYIYTMEYCLRACKLNHSVVSLVIQSCLTLCDHVDCSSPGSSVSNGKEFACNEGDHLQCRRLRFNPWVGKIPWRREQPPTPVFWPGEFHGPYNPWGRTQLSDFQCFKDGGVL